MPSNQDDLIRFTRTVAGAASAADAHRGLCELTEGRIGVRLFTIMTFDRARGQARRIYSNMPDDYPVSGTKDVDSSLWTEHVLDARQTFVANTIEGIAEVFADHELILSLGCESVINVPVVVGGEVLGTINCLHEKGFYDDGRVAASEALKLPGAVCLFMEKNASNREARNG